MTDKAEGRTIPEVELSSFGEAPEIKVDEESFRPVAWLTLGKRRLAVRSILDVPSGELQAMLAEEERLRQVPATWPEQIALARWQIHLFVPEITDADLDKLTSREIGALSIKLSTGPGMPPKAEG